MNPMTQEEARFAEALGKLSARSRQVLDGTAAGNPGKELACAIGISPRTIEMYRGKIIKALNCRNMVEVAARLARYQCRQEFELVQEQMRRDYIDVQR